MQGLHEVLTQRHRLLHHRRADSPVAAVIILTKARRKLQLAPRPCQMSCLAQTNQEEKKRHELLYVIFFYDGTYAFGVIFFNGTAKGAFLGKT